MAVVIVAGGERVRVGRCLYTNQSHSIFINIRPPPYSQISLTAFSSTFGRRPIHKSVSQHFHQQSAAALFTNQSDKVFINSRPLPYSQISLKAFSSKHFHQSIFSKHFHQQSAASLFTNRSDNVSHCCLSALSVCFTDHRSAKTLSSRTEGRDIGIIIVQENVTIRDDLERQSFAANQNGIQS